MASNGESVQEAGPSVAVQMLGLNAVPAAGDEFGVVDSEQTVQTPLILGKISLS